jgi:hypothetical protein
MQTAVIPAYSSQGDSMIAACRISQLSLGLLGCTINDALTQAKLLQPAA